jgi:hypothetical protein
MEYIYSALMNYYLSLYISGLKAEGNLISHEPGKFGMQLLSAYIG